MSWLILSWAISAAYLPLDNNFFCPGPAIESSGCFSTKFEVEASIESHCRLWASVETKENSIPGKFLFNPFRADYIAGAALYAKGIEIGIVHECDHGVESSPGITPWFGMNQTKVYVKISGKTGG